MLSERSSAALTRDGALWCWGAPPSLVRRRQRAQSQLIAQSRCSQGANVDAVSPVCVSTLRSLPPLARIIALSAYRRRALLGVTCVDVSCVQTQATDARLAQRERWRAAVGRARVRTERRRRRRCRAAARRLVARRASFLRPLHLVRLIAIAQLASGGWLLFADGRVSCGLLSAPTRMPTTAAARVASLPGVAVASVSLRRAAIGATSALPQGFVMSSHRGVANHDAANAALLRSRSPHRRAQVWSALAFRSSFGINNDTACVQWRW